MPPFQEELLARHLAALTTDHIPPGSTDVSLLGQHTSRPAGLTGVTTVELGAPTAAGSGPAPVVGPLPARRPPRDQTDSGARFAGAAAPDELPPGCLPRSGPGMGAGFVQGGVLDELPAGPALGRFADEAYERADDLDDDSLIGLLRAQDRQNSHGEARKLALIAKLARRRPADRTPPPAPGKFPEQLSEFLPDEIAMALTLTQRGAENLVALALELADRPAVGAALEAGRIDLYKAKILLEALAPLAAEHAAAVQAAILPAAPGLTSGQLRAELTRAILALNPDAIRKRREKAEKDARVELWTDLDGTATLAGRDLPPAEALAANKRICQVAAYWKKQIRAAWKQADPDGQLPRPEHGIDLLRAWAYLALLNGQPVDVPPAGFLPPADLPSCGNPDSASTGAPGPGSGGPGSGGPGPDGDTADSASPDTGGDRGTGPAGPDRPATPG